MFNLHESIGAGRDNQYKQKTSQLFFIIFFLEIRSLSQHTLHMKGNSVGKKRIVFLISQGIQWVTMRSTKIDQSWLDQLNTIPEPDTCCICV